MSLQLGKTKPRQLQYAAGGLREDLKLIELDETLLYAIKNDEYVLGYGSAGTQRSAYAAAGQTACACFAGC
jgi:hypothetical protein